MNGTTLDFTALIRAIQRLSESIDVIESFQSPSVEAALHRTLMSGVIQHFEFTYELGWKFIKRWLSVNIGKSEVEGLSRRGLFRLAKEFGLIDSVDEWMLFHAARNETSAAPILYG